MATVWAKSNGNWTTASTWAFWNESTQQVEDYGQTPKITDIVYLNGYSVYIDGDIAVQELRNDQNPFTLRSSGNVTVQATATSTFFNITANLIGSTTILIVQKNSTDWVINGNVSNCNFSCQTNVTKMTFNGNCENVAFSKVGSLTHTLLFNGTLIINSQSLISQTAYNVTVQRLIQSFPIQPSTAGVTILNVMGEYIPVGNFQSNVNIQLNGHLNLSQSNAEKPSDVIDGSHTLNLKGLTATIDQKTDYPSPENVRKNITYDFGRKVGEMEQVINNTNTINVYPYKKYPSN